MKLSPELRNYLAAWPAGEVRFTWPKDLYGAHDAVVEKYIATHQSSPSGGLVRTAKVCKPHRPRPNARGRKPPKPTDGFPWTTRQHWRRLMEQHPPRVTQRMSDALNGHALTVDQSLSPPQQFTSSYIVNGPFLLASTRRFLTGTGVLSQSLEYLKPLGPLGRRLLELDLCVEPDPATPGSYRALDPQLAWTEFQRLCQHP